MGGGGRSHSSYSYSRTKYTINGVPTLLPFPALRAGHEVAPGRFSLFIVRVAPDLCVHSAGLEEKMPTNNVNHILVGVRYVLRRAP